MKLKRKAVMLPTNKKANDSSCMALDTQLNKLLSAKEYLVTHFNSNDRFKTQHLYFLSDEEIKVGDWFLTDDRFCDIDNFGNPQWVLLHCDKIENGWIFSHERTGEGFNPDWSKTIIATTNKSLELPEPSPEFIDKFIREYNKGNVIQNVMVEYDAYNRSTTWEYDEPEIIELKVDKNNYITITREKESWNREEVIILCRKIQDETAKYKRSCHYGPNLRELNEWTDNWIEQNL